MLIGIGATAMVSIKLGQQNHDEAEKILGNAFALSFLLGIIIPAIMLVFLDPILLFLGATPDVFDYAKQFTSVILFGSVFQFISFGLNNLIRAEGSPKISMATMLFSAAMNTILNPIFIFGLHWGITGSAVASVLTQIIVSGYIIYHFTKGKSHLKLHRKYLKMEWAVIKKIFSIGLSPFLLQMAASVTSFLFNNSLLQYGGEMAVASMGVITRTAMMLLMPIFGINQGAQPIIGYNYGAKEYGRVKRTLYLAMIVATAICIFGFALIQLFSQSIMELFNSNQELIRIGAPGIRIYLAMMPIIGVQVIISNYFQAIGIAKKAILLSITRQVLFLIPLIFILPWFFQLNGIWMAGPVSDFLAFVVAVILIVKELRQLDRKAEAVRIPEMD
jgi:putative MATE family efflux protein